MNELERDVELIDYIEAVLHRKWLIGLVTVVCMAGALIHGRTEPIWYTARALIYVAQEDVGEMRATELELPSLSPAFYREIAEADQVQLIIAARQLALQDSLGIGSASIGMQVEIVEKTGIELQVRSTSGDLPVHLVNAWVDTFMVLSEGLSASELGSIYESLQAQYETAKSRLEGAENALEKFEGGATIPALSIRMAANMRQDSLLQIEILSMQQSLNSESDRLTRARSLVAGLEWKDFPIHLMTADQLDDVPLAALRPQAQQLVLSMRKRDRLEQQLLQLRASRLDRLKRLADQSQNSGPGSPTAATRAAIDSYKVATELAQQTLLTYRDSLRGVEAALYLEPEFIHSSRAIADDELWRKANGRPLTQADAKRINDLRIVADEPNPARLALQADRARYRVAIATAETRLAEGPVTMALLQVGGMEQLQALEDLQSDNDRARTALREQLALAAFVHTEASRRYESAKRVTGSLGPEVDALRQEIRDMSRRVADLRESAIETTSLLQRLTLERDRLERNHETLSATHARFAQLTEEARIAAQIASGNLRVITRPVTPVAVGIDARRQALLAGSVGLGLSIAFALLLEYIANARAARAARGARV